ncbi:ABC transporter permease [Coxiella endosymbiont of Dermacentor marginatus]|uniref:ABC transporter permease n=1 Tax=Coxiella endosymbiont of Dermacentor marginatus TaxID=1656159 RepID=UPI003873BDCC
MVFSLIVTWIAVYQGYDLKSNAVRISRATIKTVVYLSMIVLALDFILIVL